MAIFIESKNHSFKSVDILEDKLYNLSNDEEEE
jgi:hypothetical protein